MSKALFSPMLKMNKGYTLLEVMIATAVMGILLLAATGLFFSIIRGGGKVRVTAEVNQNGEIVMGTMERLIRNSVKVTSACAGEAAASLTVVDRYGRAITFSCEDVGQDDAYHYSHIASNSAWLTSENVAVTACSFTCTPDPGGYGPATVLIDFSLRQFNQNPLQGEAESQQFTTTVSLRNY